MLAMLIVTGLLLISAIICRVKIDEIEEWFENRRKEPTHYRPLIRPMEFISEVIIFIIGIPWVIAIIALPTQRYLTYSNIEAFKTTKVTIEEARKNDKSKIIENAALQHKIIEKNEWLTKTKYNNRHFFDIYIPDEIEELDYLE